MTRFILRRLLETLVLLFAVAVLVFGLFQLIPGDFLTEMELQPHIPSELITQLRRDYGLERSLPQQFWSWMGNLLRGELGFSFAQQRPAAELIEERLAASLLLGGAALLIMLALSFGLGIAAALRPGGLLDGLVLIFCLAGLSIPFVLSSLLFLYVALATGWFPLGGTGGVRHLILPALTLALPGSAFLTRTLRMELLATFEEPYMLTARAKGLPPLRVLYHALRGALNPVLSLLGVLVGGLLGGAVVVESVFNWPGLGLLTVQSILARDLFVALDCVLVATVLTVLANLGAELALAWNDPRIRQW